MIELPELRIKELTSTRDYLREVCLVLGGFQRAFLPKHPRDWQHGLEVNLRGVSTQTFKVGDSDMLASLDLVGRKVRLDGNKWPLRENPAPVVLENIKAWLDDHGQNVELDEPKFVSGTVEYDTDQSDAYAAALWWMDEQFLKLKDSLKDGLVSPVLLYPHHFDLSLTWFPFDDERQLAIGWSTGDETIPEPYIYLTSYPEPASFKSTKLPERAYWQSEGFSGAILPYEALHASTNPEELFQEFAKPFFTATYGQFDV